MVENRRLRSPSELASHNPDRVTQLFPYRVGEELPTIHSTFARVQFRLNQHIRSALGDVMPIPIDRREFLKLGFAEENGAEGGT